MAGKTVSAYVDENTARRVEHVARVEARPVSQIASAALALYARLPSEAHQALRTIEALGGAEALDAVTRTVARRLVDAEYELAERRVADAVPDAVVAGLAGEDDLLAAAVRLTADAGRSTSEIAAGGTELAGPRRRSGGRRAARG